MGFPKVFSTLSHGFRQRLQSIYATWALGPGIQLHLSHLFSPQDITLHFVFTVTKHVVTCTGNEFICNADTLRFGNHIAAEEGPEGPPAVLVQMNKNRFFRLFVQLS